MFFGTYARWLMETDPMGPTTLQFDVPWADVKKAYENRRMAAAVVVIEVSDNEDACSRGIYDAATRDATMYMLLAEYSSAEGTVRLDAHQIADIFMPHTGGKVMAQSAPSYQGRW